MPGQMAGAGLAAQIRNFPQTRSLPILLMSSVGARSEVVTAAAATSFLAKPIKPAQLQSALISLISGANPVEKRVAPPPKLNSALAERFPLRVLLADDNIINQKVALRLLQQLGYRADIANNGLEVLQALEQKPYDIIFMDVQMPGLDGLEASRRIRQRQQEPSPHPHFKQGLTIVAMTANAMQGDREKCFAAGMNDYIPKPVRPEALQAVLERLAGAAALSAPSQSQANLSSSSRRQNSSAATPPSPDSENPSVDLERLMDFAGGEMESFQELANLYLKQTTQQLQQISIAISQGNAAAVASVAHSCAGASSTCGMMAIVPVLRELEQCGKAGEIAALPKLLQAVNREFERIQLFFDNHAKTDSSAAPSSSPL